MHLIFYYDFAEEKKDHHLIDDDPGRARASTIHKLTNMLYRYNHTQFDISEEGSGSDGRHVRMHYSAIRYCRHIVSALYCTHNLSMLLLLDIQIAYCNLPRRIHIFLISFS